MVPLLSDDFVLTSPDSPEVVGDLTSQMNYTLNNNKCICLFIINHSLSDSSEVLIYMKHTVLAHRADGPAEMGELFSLALGDNPQPQPCLLLDFPEMYAFHFEVFMLVECYDLTK